MKKLLTLVVVLLFASTAFAQDMTKAEKLDNFKKVFEQLEAKNQNRPQTKFEGKEAWKNNILPLIQYSKFMQNKRESSLQKGAQTAVDPVLTEVWAEDFEGPTTPALPAGWEVVDNSPTSTLTNIDITTFNAYRDDGGEFSWWIGSNNPIFNYPGYGNNWAVTLQTDRDYQIQSDLTDPKVRTMFYGNIEEGWDFLLFQVSTDDGATWEWHDKVVTGLFDSWQTLEYSLDGYQGEFIRFRWVFVSDQFYSNQDGLISTPASPGAAFFDRVSIVRDGTAELIDDGGDTKLTLQADDYLPDGAWISTSADYSSDTTSAVAGGDIKVVTTLYSSGFDIDALGNGIAPLWLTFNIRLDDFVNGLVYIGLRDTTTGARDTLGYLAPGWDDESWAEVGPIDITAFRDGADYSYNGQTQLWFEFQGDLLPETAGYAWLDDVIIYQVEDPYENNNEPDSCYNIAYGFVSQWATIYDETPPENDVDWYCFEGEAGDLIDIVVLGTMIDSDPYLYYVDPLTGMPYSPYNLGSFDYNWFGFGDGGLPWYYDRFIGVLPASGTYMIAIASWTGIGSYELWLDKLNTEPVISRIDDVDNDQGKKVTVRFEGVDNDVAHSADLDFFDVHLTNYSVFRMDGSIISSYDTQVGTVQKAGLEEYGTVVPTEMDSTDTDFYVVANLVSDMYSVNWAGAPETGESYDNIAPSFVAEYTLAPESGEGVDVGAEVDYGGGNDGISDVAFYNIYRGEESGFTPSAANKIATVETHSQEVRYNDAEYDGTVDYYYVIEVVDDGGNKVYSEEVSSITSVENEAVPTVYSLAQNYPNPFNPATTIKFGIPQAADVTIKIYDILGQEVQTLVNRNLSAGFHTVNFNASNLISGMYIYRIQANGVDGSNFTDVKKMLLVK